ncbi:uncharacterized protein LOC114936032 isoform X3 [Nylanderia fulva]|uniref:uncharacterized protein LOC114936032 isoform X3 n=1 Tax=Nylanderia fulva TaxID=613905 RepID=UPI0010FB664F|nr:uncharacterized protein LOC114936032 isoform X3 [Nylanderia fulva]
MELFPVETLEKLQELEQLLINDKINRKALMKQLARIGGTDIKSITFNILRRIMSDSVGSAVRIYFPEATEQNISQPIKSWLRHANERSNKKNLNKSKKSLMQEDENQSNMEQHADRRPQKENMDKRAESVARVCLQEDNQEADDDDGDETTLDDLIGPNLF